MSRLLAVTLSAVLTATTFSQPATAAPTSPHALALRVDYLGGSIPTVRQIGRIPAVSIYRDGTVIIPGPSIAIYPPPALPSLQTTTIARSNVRVLERWAVAAGVTAITPADVGSPTISGGVPITTRFTMFTPAGPKRLAVSALEQAFGPAHGLTPTQSSRRRTLVALHSQLVNVTGMAETPFKPYQPWAVSAVASLWTLEDEEVPALWPRKWIGPKLPGKPLVGSISCVLVTGPALAKLLKAAETARTLTPWLSDGRLWTVALRPLLPEQRGCSDLAPTP